MRKALIIILLITVSGCSAKRLVVNYHETDQTTPEEIVRRVMTNNLTNEGFYIEKASLSFTINGEAQKYLFSVKFSPPQNYLFSLKSTTGIEGARILITPDTLLVNDRIRKRVLLGEPEDIEKKTGVSAEMIGIVFGDFFPAVEDSGIVSGNSGSEIAVIQKYRNKILRSVLDRKIGKTISVSVFSSHFQPETQKDSISISFSKFRTGEKNIPSRIEVNDFRNNIIAKIKIEKVTYPWNGEAEFIAGKGYKIERIK